MRPFLDVEVEAADAHHDVVAGAALHHLTALVDVGEQPLLPAVDHFLGQAEGVDARVVGLDVGPEHARQLAGQSGEGAVVDAGSALFEVADQQVAHGCALKVVEVDQFGGGPLAVPQRVLEGVLGVDHTGSAQQIPGAVSAVVGVADGPPPPGPRLEDVLGGELVEVTAGMQDHLGEHAQALIGVPASHAQLAAVASHLIQGPGREHALDVLEQRHGLVVAHELVVGQHDAADEHAVQTAQQRRSAPLVAVAVVGLGEHLLDPLLAPVGAGRPPAGPPAVPGVREEPVEDLPRPDQAVSAQRPAVGVLLRRPDRGERQQGQDVVASQMLVGADALLVRLHVVDDEQAPLRGGAGAREYHAVGAAAHAAPPPNSTSRSLAS